MMSERSLLDRRLRSDTARQNRLRYSEPVEIRESNEKGWGLEFDLEEVWYRSYKHMKVTLSVDIFIWTLGWAEVNGGRGSAEPNQIDCGFLECISLIQFLKSYQKSYEES